MKTLSELIDEMHADGLTEDEIKYRVTPVGKMNPQQRMTAIAVDDKYRKIIFAQNEEIRRAQAEAKAFAEAEIDADDDFNTDNLIVKGTEKYEGITPGAFPEGANLGEI